MKQVVLFVVFAGAVAGFVLALNQFAKKPDLMKGIGLAASGVGVVTSLRAL
jgi:hypothetical protein